MIVEEHPIVTAYVAAINTRLLDALLGLFAEGSYMVNRFGRYDTPHALRAFYRDRVMELGAVLAAATVMADVGIVMAEISASSPLTDDDDVVVRALDVFRLTPDGLIASLEIYYL